VGPVQAWMAQNKATERKILLQCVTLALKFLIVSVFGALFTRFYQNKQLSFVSCFFISVYFGSSVVIFVSFNKYEFREFIVCSVLDDCVANLIVLCRYTGGSPHLSHPVTSTVPFYRVIIDLNKPSVTSTNIKTESVIIIFKPVTWSRFERKV